MHSPCSMELVSFRDSVDDIIGTNGMVCSHWRRRKRRGNDLKLARVNSNLFEGMKCGGGAWKLPRRGQKGCSAGFDSVEEVRSRPTYET